MGHEPVDRLTWHKGRPCENGACVEIAAAGEDVLVRSSLSPSVRLTLTRGEWAEFLACAKDGLFDWF